MSLFSVSGQLWMWGSSSHVIPPSDPHKVPSKQGTHWKVFLPQRVACGVGVGLGDGAELRPVLALACGAWHATAVTGMPGMVLTSSVYFDIYHLIPQ